MITDKLFFDDAYGIAVRKKCRDTMGDFRKKAFCTKYPTWNYWYADPFVCNDKGKEYVFVEAYDYYKGIGRIAAAPVTDSGIGDFTIVIKENFHMSFPNVFKYHGEWYMLPETCECSQLRLYKCREFPLKWELYDIIQKTEKLADSVVTFIDEDTILIQSCDVGIRDGRDYIVKYSIPEKRVIEQFKSCDKSSGRAAGEVYLSGDQKFRFIQNCEATYGDFLEQYKISDINEHGFTEQFAKTVKAEDVAFDVNNKIEHIHTYNCDDSYEVIDFRYRKLYPLKIVARFISRVLYFLRIVIYNYHK